MKTDDIKRALSRLPQRHNIPSGDIINWLDQVSKNVGPDQIVWHLDRQRAVGGSESGTLVLEAMGLTPPFGRTGNLLAGEKLFKVAPSRPLPHMKRGTMLEQAFIEAMLNIYGGDRDHDAEASFKKPCPEAPASMEGNPDLYWKLNGKRILVDTKVPISATEQEDVYSSENHKLLSYKTQTHHYDILGTARGFKADNLVIAELDVPVELADAWVDMIRLGQKESVVDQMTSLLKSEKPGLRINFIEVEQDLQVDFYGKPTHIKEAIQQACTDFMNGVVNGDIQQTYEPIQEELTEEHTLHLNSLESQIANIRAIAEQSQDDLSKKNEELRSYITDNKLSAKQVNMDMISVSEKQNFNMNAAVATLSRYNVDLNSLKQDIDPDSATSKQIDMAKAISMLREHGLLEHCLSEAPYSQEKVTQALIKVDENPDTFSETEVSLRKATSKLAKQRYSELRGYAEGIEEVINVKQLRELEMHSQHEPDSEQQTPAGLLKLG